MASAGSADGAVLVWEVAKGTVATRLRPSAASPGGASGHSLPQPAVACAWSPLGLPLVAGDKGGALAFWGGAAGGGR